MKFQIVAQMVKNLPAKQETQVQSLDWEDPLEKKMTTHSSIPEWEIPWTGKPGGVQSTRSQRVGHNQSNTYTHTHTYNIHPWSFKQKTPIFYTIPLAMLLHSFKQITSFFFFLSSPSSEFIILTTKEEKLQLRKLSSKIEILTAE